MMRTYSGHSTATASNELYRTNLAKGQTGLSIAFDLPTQTGYDPDHPLAQGEVGKVGVPVAHLGHMQHAARRHPRRRDEHVDDDQRDRGVAARPLRRQRRGQGVDAEPLRGTTQNDIVKEYLSPGHLHLPAAAEPAADRRHGRVLRGVDPEVEPDERVQLPPAGGGCDAGAGARVLARDRDRRARRGARVGSGRRRPLPRRVRVDLVLRQRRHPVRRGDVQDARLHRSCGTASASSATASPIRRRAASATACR